MNPYLKSIDDAPIDGSLVWVIDYKENEQFYGPNIFKAKYNGKQWEACEGFPADPLDIEPTHFIEFKESENIPRNT